MLGRVKSISGGGVSGESGSSLPSKGCGYPGAGGEISGSGLGAICRAEDWVQVVPFLASQPVFIHQF